MAAATVRPRSLPLARRAVVAIAVIAAPLGAAVLTGCGGDGTDTGVTIDTSYSIDPGDTAGNDTAGNDTAGNDTAGSDANGGDAVATDTGGGGDAVGTDSGGDAPCSPVAESCNGADDDCDGATDEDTCDDGAECTTDSCAGSPAACVHSPVADGSTCDDGTACTSGDACAGGMCKGIAKPCDDAKPCTTDACDAATGTCGHSAKADGEPCDDGSACSKDDTCKGGACAGSVTPCDDNNPCTKDTCDVVKGCQHASDQGAACDDGDPCTKGDACIFDTCVGGDPLVCAAAKPCETAACDATSGTCKVTAKPDGAACDDGQGCTSDDTCTLGTCLGKAKSCDDSNACTADACDAATGLCVNTPAIGANPCDDGSKCTVDDKCAGGSCVGKKLSCDDSNLCTEDMCEAATGCFGLPKAGACEDGSACTSGDACADGVCKPGVAKVCDDGSPCTNDACDPASGACSASGDGLEGKPCDDGSKCTNGEACAAGQCLGGKPKDCDDGAACTADICDAASGLCGHSALGAGAKCSDGSLCTISDTCDAIGVCLGKKIPCDDGQVCTIDGCDAKTGGCTFEPMIAGVLCDDGNACTAPDQCSGKGGCVSGKQKDCDDGVVCTTDACDTKTGQCQHANVPKTCDDGDACTLADACRDGSCKPEPQGEVSTVAGATGGFADGAVKSALFNGLRGGIADADGSLVVADTNNHRIRRVAADKVSTVAGSGGSGAAEGAAATATFSSPTDVARVGAVLYVADLGNHRVRTIQGGNVSTAFGGSAGLAEGSGSAAKLQSAEGVAAGPDGALWVADTGNHAIRRVDADGILRVVAGGTAGYADGTGTVARFNAPRGIAVDAAGIAWVADANNHRLRRVLPGGQVTTVAGSGVAGLQDGAAASARFYSPMRLAVRADGALVVADTSSHAVRLVKGDQVTTLAGTTTAGFLDAVGAAARFNSPMGIAIAGDGAIWVADTGNHRLRRLATGASPCDDGLVCTKDSCDKTSGCKHEAEAAGGACSDGNLCTAGDACSASGACLGKATSCADGNACTVDVCNPTDGKCETIASTGACEDGDLCMGPDACQGGSCKLLPTLKTWIGGSAGALDGNGTKAQLNSPTGACPDGSGGLFVADRGNHRVRKVAADGAVTTYAGSSGGYADGAADKAQFSSPSDVVVALDGAVIVSDRSNHRIRKISNGVVSSLAGAGVAAFADGVGGAARFYYPEGVAVHASSGDIFVADTYNNRIRRVTSAGVVTTVAGDGGSGYLEGKGTTARFYRPADVALDGDGVLYVADTYNHRIRKVAADGTTTLVAGTGTASFKDGPGNQAMFYYPRGVTFDGAGMLAVADTSNNRLRSIDATGNVLTLAGTGSPGALDGPVGVGQLSQPYDVAYIANAGLVVVDTSNQRIRSFGVGAKDCDDLDPCTVDACSAVDGSCSHQSIPNCCSPIKQNFTFAEESQGGGWTFESCSTSGGNTPAGCSAYTPSKDTKGWHVRPDAPIKNLSPGGLYYGSDATNDFNFGASAGSATSPPWTVPGPGSKIALSVWWNTESGSSYDRLFVFLLVNGQNIGTIVSKGVSPFENPSVWVNGEVDVSKYVGSKVQLMFYFNTVDSVGNSGTGVYIDDVRYTSPCN